MSPASCVSGMHFFKSVFVVENGQNKQLIFLDTLRFVNMICRKNTIYNSAKIQLVGST